MDKPWMHADRRSKEFELGFEEFLKFDESNAVNIDKISCPCMNCCNTDGFSMEVGIPEQLGDKTCGYFIMLYMREIVLDKNQDWSKKWLTRGDAYYTMENVDVVRQEWANAHKPTDKWMKLAVVLYNRIEVGLGQLVLGALYQALHTLSLKPFHLLAGPFWILDLWRQLYFPLFWYLPLDFLPEDQLFGFTVCRNPANQTPLSFFASLFILYNQLEPLSTTNMMVRRCHPEVLANRFFPRPDSESDIKTSFMRVVSRCDICLTEEEQGFELYAPNYFARQLSFVQGVPYPLLPLVNKYISWRKIGEASRVTLLEYADDTVFAAIFSPLYDTLSKSDHTFLDAQRGHAGIPRRAAAKLRPALSLAAPVARRPTGIIIREQGPASEVCRVCLDEDLLGGLSLLQTKGKPLLKRKLWQIQMRRPFRQLLSRQAERARVQCCHVRPRLDNVEDETRITKAVISEPILAADEEVPPPSPIGGSDNTVKEREVQVVSDSPPPIQEADLVTLDLVKHAGEVLSSLVTRTVCLRAWVTPPVDPEPVHLAWDFLYGLMRQGPNMDIFDLVLRASKAHGARIRHFAYSTPILDCALELIDVVELQARRLEDLEVLDTSLENLFAFYACQVEALETQIVELQAQLAQARNNLVKSEGLRTGRGGDPGSIGFWHSRCG
ncbi:hypothetical protein ACLB2K_029648 [Fragaria x ananassa]